MNLSTVASTCSEITVILAAVAMLVKPLRNKLLGPVLLALSPRSKSGYFSTI